MNQLFNPNANGAGGNPLIDWFRNIVGVGGQQLGDFFAGNAEQWQTLADRLFRLDNQALGSPPTSDAFVGSLTPIEWEPGVCQDDTCAICLEQFAAGAQLVFLPCRHAFHTDCIAPWLKMHSECPSCRYKLPS
jgi:E3 ubiquitin-protein ligase RNF115/126